MKPVLFVGGAGAVGRPATTALRRLHPEVPILIGGRDVEKAGRLARELGNATAVAVDLERADLGLGDTPVGSVVVLLKDERLTTLDFALARRLPYVSFADFVFDVAPTVGRYVARPDASPILMLGQVLGSTVSLLTLHAARALRHVDAIAIATLLDEDDRGGPEAQADMERLARAPKPLIRVGGRFVWAEGDALRRTFVDTHGISRIGEAMPLIDVASLGATTGAPDVRVDIAVRPRAEENPRGRANETIVDMVGRDADGTRREVRLEIVDRDGYSGTSGRGAALAVERVLGLAGGPPLAPGMYQPEGILDPAHVAARLGELGLEVREARS